MSDAVGKLFGIPLWMKDQRRYDLATRYPSLSWKALGVDEPAAAMASVQGPSVWAYRFDWDEQPSVLWLDLAKLLGACHALEVPFMMASLDLGPANPLAKCLCAAADLGCDRADRFPLGTVLLLMLEHHPHSALAHLV